MKKEEALKILFECAALYKENLVNRNLLFVCSNAALKVSVIEVVFTSGNFLHMTGIKFKSSKSMKPNEFYNKCIDKRLSVNDFEFSKDGTTELKLLILPFLVKSNISATMAGDYYSSRPYLYTEKLVGGIRGGIGFIYDKRKGYYVPNTVINDDIRKITQDRLRVIGTYRKQNHDEKYSECVYKAKNVNWEKITVPPEYDYLRKKK